jgi:GNAT superfamily N-acetyltransferase
VRNLAPQVRQARSADAASIARVQVVSWQHAYRDILPASFLEGLDAERSAESWRVVVADPRRVTFVLEAPDLVGFCTAGPARGSEASGHRGEVEAIYVRPADHRRGFGTSLIRAATEWLAESKLQPVVVWALEANEPAHRFYERLGARQIDRRLLRIADALYPELAFGWPVGAFTGR